MRISSTLVSFVSLLLAAHALPGTVSAAEGSAPPETIRRESAEQRSKLADEIEIHWRKELLPKWFPRCVDREHGGFFPDLREDWSLGDTQDKTIVYQARMTWVCAQVAMRYPDVRDEYLGYTRHGIACLSKIMWDKEKGGFFWGLDNQGRVVSRYGDEKHAYGISFGLYACSAAYEATHDADALELARKTFEWLEQHSHDGEHGGYFEALTRDGKPIMQANLAPGRSVDHIGTRYGFKSMNSHIHLLEALTALYRVWPDPRAEQRLREVYLLVRDKIAVEPGCLNLFFTPDWRAVPDHDSFGHDIETAFLLIEAAEALHEPRDPRTLTVARSLVDHALEWGWDEQRGGFYDRGAAFAPAWKREKVWWTQAEGLNALLLMHEQFGQNDPRYYRAFLQQWDFIRKFQNDRRYSGWYESVSEEGVAAPNQPKSSIWKAAYHDGRALMNVSAQLRKLSH